MGCKDFMIGDVYRNSDGDVCVVERNFGSVVWGVGVRASVSDSTDDPRPVRITEEMMLEKGFREYGSNLRMDVGDFQIYYSKDRLLTIFNSAVLNDRLLTLAVEDVHEMQHALRLCGLGDLAEIMVP